MREHSYMEMSLRGSELVRVSPTEIGATCACLLAREHRNKNLADASLFLTRYAAAAVAVPPLATGSADAVVDVFSKMGAAQVEQQNWIAELQEANRPPFRRNMGNNGK